MGVIIVGVDGTEPAGQAALTAARLATALGSELRVVCGYGRFEVEQIEDDRELALSTAETAIVVGEQTVRRLKAVYPEVNATVQASGGKPADALLAVAEQVDAELIVVGNKRVQGASRILGSIATELARKAQCDLYIAYTHARK